MPLTRRDPPTNQPGPPKSSDWTTLAPDLRQSDAARRWAAARLLGEHPESVPALVEALAQEHDDAVREAILTSLVRIGGVDTAQALLAVLRSDDAALRAGALDALQTMPDAVLPELEALLSDPDVDVRILVTDLARTIPAPEANRLLCRLLDDEHDPNVCAAAVDVLSEIGTPECVPALERCAARFGSEAFLPFAVQVTLQRIAADG
jgi:HEAT repeat protein